MILAHEHGRAWTVVLLLVLATPPPILVRGHGALSIEDAVGIDLERISARHGRPVPAPDPSEMVAWTTWADIGAQVGAAAETYDNPDDSTRNAVARIAGTIADALLVHG